MFKKLVSLKLSVMNDRLQLQIQSQKVYHMSSLGTTQSYDSIMHTNVKRRLATRKTKAPEVIK